jgi:hypothetical protein
VNVSIDAAQAGGKPCFVMLHFTGAAIPAGGQVQVPLGYDLDVFTGAAGTEFWSRPIDPVPVGGSIQVTFIGLSGGVTIEAYGSGEPLDSIQFSTVPGAFEGSHSDPDTFLFHSPYVEPIYETRLKCHNPFAWLRAAKASTSAEQGAVAATGIIVMTEEVTPSGQAPVTILSSCTGTLVGPDLFITARHCATDADHADVRSASVCFDFATDANGLRPAGYAPRWYKVLGEVASGAPPNGNSPAVNSDWLILRLDTGATGIPITPRNLGRPQPLQVGEQVFTAHHPNGAAKKFQRGTLSTTNLATGVMGFDFAGGSSGSALFDANGNVIGATLANGPITGPCDVGYCPASNVVAVLDNPPVHAAPWDVVIVMDRSGSMAGDGGNGRPKIDEARDAAAQFVRMIETGRGDEVGIESFSTSASQPHDKDPVKITTGGVNQLVGSGPAPGGVLPSINPGGLTSIGDGLKVASGMFPAPHKGSTRAILLLTDGLQNTAPMIDDVSGQLGPTQIFIVGYGDDSNLNGPLLTRVAREHGGLFIRANHGLAVRKFFGLSFGNIFKTGSIVDPEFDLPTNTAVGTIVECPVFEETELTALVGWDRPIGAVAVRIIAPDGTVIEATTSGTASDTGATWSFVRVPLPFAGNREGKWLVVPYRPQLRGREPVALRYFVTVIADGGPRFYPLRPDGHVDVGDPMPILAALHYPDRTTPPAEVDVTVTAPTVSLRDILSAYGPAPAGTGPDPVNSWTATLQLAAAANGGQLPVAPITRTFHLFDDGDHGDGAMEPDGIYGLVVDDLTKVDGTYEFQAVARYGSQLQGRRETTWSVTVGLKDDPYSWEAPKRGRTQPPSQGKEDKPSPRARKQRG